ncbi:hypothetical protein KUTeg_007505 [Tegillarca granosa]|uniref:Uncharacterized protein n=1 Tax=Tegillarca granosa TaxID=220873 RepID=A0ABQ9FGH1_TEGGR|nr:hypothetical protein KUTeg_007505 [Tegillarca granosa]
MQLKVWSAETGQCAATMVGHRAGDREVLTEGKLLLLGCENSNLLAYGLQSRKKIFDVPCHGAVNCCCFLSDISAVCGTEDGHLTVIDLRNPRVPLKEWKESRSAILSVCPYNRGFWSSSGRNIVFNCIKFNQSTDGADGFGHDYLAKWKLGK